MSTLVTANKIKFEYPGNHNLFDEINFSIQADDKIGLIGKNGTGKTSLLKIIYGKVHPTSGSLVTNSSIYLTNQMDQRDNKAMIFEYVSHFYPSWWEVEQFVMDEFGMKIGMNQQLEDISGGEKMLIDISIGLKLSPDLLLLDEPTNHLDRATIGKLTMLLSNHTGAYVISTHNREFLNHTCNVIWNLDKQKLLTHKGTYDDFLAFKESRLQNIQRQAELGKRKMNKLKIIASQKKSEAKSTDDKVQRDPYTKKLMGKKARTAMLMNKKIETKLADYQKTIDQYKTRSAHFKFPENEEYSDRMLLEITDGVLHINNSMLIDEINMHIRFGDKIALTGRNGSGKSSLIKAILGDKQYKLDGIIKKYTNKILLLDQSYNLINSDKSLIENMQNINNMLTNQEIRENLGNFLFVRDESVHKPAGNLSGGEIARLGFAMITSSQADIVMLDEPTNNLDIETIEVIENGLNIFKGALLVISHDDEFMSKIGIHTRYFISEGKFKTV